MIRNPRSIQKKRMARAVAKRIFFNFKKERVWKLLPSLQKEERMLIILRKVKETTLTNYYRKIKLKGADYVGQSERSYMRGKS